MESAAAMEKKIQDLGLTAPCVTLEQVTHVIADEAFMRVANTTLTLCILTLKNGTVLVGKSACVSPENFKLEVGTKLAHDDAVKQIWALEGYALAEKLRPTPPLQTGRVLNTVEIVEDILDYLRDLKGRGNEIGECDQEVMAEIRRSMAAIVNDNGAASKAGLTCGHPVERLAGMLGGKIDEVVDLPDGSGFATVSMPLPKDHWLYDKGPTGYGSPPPMPFRMVASPERVEAAEKIREAGKYAVRGATMHGECTDFDPDALLQNLVVGMIGYWTDDGLSTDGFCNPDPVPDVTVI